MNCGTCTQSASCTGHGFRCEPLITTEPAHLCSQHIVCGVALHPGVLYATLRERGVRGWQSDGRPRVYPAVAAQLGLSGQNAAVLLKRKVKLLGLEDFQHERGASWGSGPGVARVEGEAGGSGGGGGSDSNALRSCSCSCAAAAGQLQLGPSSKGKPQELHGLWREPTSSGGPHTSCPHPASLPLLPSSAGQHVLPAPAAAACGLPSGCLQHARRLLRHRHCGGMGGRRAAAPASRRGQPARGGACAGQRSAGPAASASRRWQS